MPLAQEFRTSLAKLFGIDVSQIEVNPDGVNIAGSALPAPGVFDVAALLESFNIVETAANRVKVTDGHRTITLSRVAVRPQPEHGIIEVGAVDAKLFLGSFGTTVGQIDIVQCPELLICIACFDPQRTQPVREWAAILEAWGPFVISEGEPPHPALAEIGCFLESGAPSLPEFSLPSQARAFRHRITTSKEAVNAYVLGLQSTDGPDIAFLRLYRIFELEFAATLQSEMAKAALSQVYEKLRMLHSVNEIEILRRTIDRSLVPVTRFTCGDFRTLFGAQPPSREQYKRLAKWVESGTGLPEDCRAHVIYYIRCALVHRKFSETEQFLFGPFEGNRAVALTHIVSDMREILRDILAT
ncbi:MAG: hypothetical protein WBV55_24825 [Candidatus Sulfotelmatobacter sp.]